MRMRRGATALTLAVALTTALASCALPGSTPRATGTAGLNALVKTIPELTGAPDYYDYLGDRWSGTGPVYADVTMTAVSQDRLATIVNEIGEFLAAGRNGPVSWDEVHLEMGQWTLVVRDRRAENNEMREAYRVLSADPTVEGGHVGRYASVIVPKGKLTDAYASLQSSLLADVFVGSHGIEVDSDDEDAAFEMYGDADDSALLMSGTYGQLDSAFTLVSATVSSDEVDVSVDAAQLTAARRLAARLSASSGATVDVTLGDPGSGS